MSATVKALLIATMKVLMIVTMNAIMKAVIKASSESHDGSINDGNNESD
jgi:hypothetical protein